MFFLIWLAIWLNIKFKEATTEATISIAKALADRNRMRVLTALLRHEELCVCQVVEMLRLATATVSRHMSVLQHARLVQSRKDGRWVYYRMAGSFPQKLREWLLESLADSKEILTDKIVLERILSGRPEELCRQQREKKECRVGKVPSREAIINVKGR